MKKELLIPLRFRSEPISLRPNSHSTVSLHPNCYWILCHHLFFFSQLLFLRKNLMKTLGSSSAHSAAVCMAESKTAPCSHTLFFQLLLAGEHRTKLSCHLLENSPSLWLILRGISALCSPALSGCQALYFQLVHLWYVQQGHAGQVGSISCFPIAELFQNSLFWPISPTCWLKA